MERYLKLSHDIIKSNALTPSEFRVLVYLMCFDPCHPSHKNIANQTGLNYKTVNRALKSLNTKGLLFWTKGNSFGKNNAYKIYPNAIKKLTKDYPQNGVSSTPKKGSVKGTIRNFENVELENLDKFSQLSKEEPNWTDSMENVYQEGRDHWLTNANVTKTEKCFKPIR